jgi:hypothetical protein
MAKENYRPVSILFVGSKILEEIVREKLTKHQRKFCIIPQEQHGFQQSRSTSSAAHVAIHDWWMNISKDKAVSMAMFDLSSVFDLVDANLLVEKLRIFGTEQATCQLIISYMSGRFQLVQVGEACSQERNLHQHDHKTRSLISGVVTQQATYDSFIKKSAVIFN